MNELNQVIHLVIAKFDWKYACLAHECFLFLFFRMMIRMIDLNVLSPYNYGDIRSVVIL